LKSIVQIIFFSLALFATHKWIVLPQLDLKDTMPVVLQHLLLGGFTLLIYAVTEFTSKYYLSIAGFLVLGFLMLKMVFLAIFINAYDAEVTAEPVLKYIFLGFYFVYLIFLLLKIIPLFNLDFTEKKQ